MTTDSPAALRSEASMILRTAAKPQKRFPAVIMFGRR
jgi:hypothetical protein